MRVSAAAIGLAYWLRRQQQERVVYTLHVYDHCPFCNRVEWLMGHFGLKYKRVLYGYGAGASCQRYYDCTATGTAYYASGKEYHDFGAEATTRELLQEMGREFSDFSVAGLSWAEQRAREDAELAAERSAEDAAADRARAGESRAVEHVADRVDPVHRRLVGRFRRALEVGGDVALLDLEHQLVDAAAHLHHRPRRLAAKCPRPSAVDAVDHAAPPAVGGAARRVVRVLDGLAHAVLPQLFTADAKARKANTFNSVSRRFINDLNTLMDDLNSTKAHFVRCIKPNKELAAFQFTPSLVLNQLRDRRTVEPVVAGRRRVEAPDQVHQGRLA